MGHGAPRELSSNAGAKKPLDPDDSEKLEAALKRFEQKDSEFRTSREDERHQQMSKAWVSRCHDLVDDLRSIGYAIVAQHQVLLDMGQDGAGVGASPWIEEAGLKFDRMYIRLREDEVVAEVNQKILTRAENMDQVDYEWLEKAVVAWLVDQATKK